MPAELWRFQDFELDPNAYRLLRAGRIVRLERIPLELLFLLVAHPGQTVARDEILDHIWGKGVFIDSEHAINTAIRKIRRALNDDADAPRFIVTIPGKGYRFIAPVVLVNGEPKTNEHSEEPRNNESAEFGSSRPGSLETHLDSPGYRRAGLFSVADSGERRHLTVLFCDLVNSTGLAAQLDPEEWREVVVNYHRSATQEIERFGGHVAQFLGDGVIAYFGWPEAHDNDVERAVRAGLAILDAISNSSAHPFDSNLAARVGIDSGVVVIGDATGKGADVYGEAPNMAARVQGAAEPAALLITEAAHRLIPGLFEVEKCGPQILKGIADPVSLYRVIGPSGMRGRLAAAAVRGLTPFVGREDELRLLMNRWERTLDGEGQMVLIVGEPGIGKSRLVQRLGEQIATDTHTWLESAAVPLFLNTPFYAVIDILQQGLHWESGHNAEQKRAALEASVAGINLEGAVPLLAKLLELPLDPEYPVSPLPPNEQRKRLLATLVAWICAAAKNRPLVLVIEDLHWADPSTLELIQLLVEQGATTGLLLLFTARPEFHASWPPHAHHTQITLNRLSTREAREMIARVAAVNSLGADTVSTMIERTSGVPLFVEELTRAVLESGNGMLSEREIPVTLHDSLMARMDRLGPAKEVLQIAAVIGSEFSYELLHGVHPLADEEFQKALRTLVDAELLYVRGTVPDANYQFKHALIRDAAYEALLKSRRKDLHRLTAQTISENFPVLKAAQPEVLARHWTEAGETEFAIAEWSRAGKSAEARSAFIETQESVEQALALLNLLPKSRERDFRELELRQSLVSMLHLTRGWAAPETVEAAARIGVLAEKSGDLLRQIGSACTSCLHVLLSGDLATAAVLADEGLELALRAGNPGRSGGCTRAIAASRHIQLMVHYFRGDFAGAENHFALGLKFFDDPALNQDSQNGAVSIFAYASFNAWILGRADVARERLAKMRAAVNPANPHAVARSHEFAAQLHALIRENATAEALAARALELFDKHRFPHEAATARCWLGYARAQLGRAAEGIVLIRAGIAMMPQNGNRLGVAFHMTRLAAAQLRASAVGDALETVEQALNFNPELAVWRPETLRIRGELRLKQGDRQLAEADFRDSIAMSRNMGAKAWELRTTMNLARMLDSEGHRNEARTMLADIYNWFTEGCDTPDLKDAKALLDELAV